MDWLTTLSGFFVWLGGSLGRKIPERVLRTAFAEMLALVGGKLAL
jgi:uncharacterized membrane protein YfcA